MRIKQVLIIFLMVFSVGQGFANTAPPSHINTFQIAFATAKHVFDYTHFKLIGTCVWLDTHGPFHIPYLAFTPELDEYLPDLVVTSFNEAGDDPWDAPRLTLDKASYAAGNAAARATTGFSLGNGQIEVANNATQHGNGIITKYVDVIGNPYPLAYFPFLSLRLDTAPFMPYYSSAMDTPGRLGLAEAWRVVKNMNLFRYYIGQSFVNKWGYEFPRNMTSVTTNDYEASVMAALRAADIVTNVNALHVVKSTSDSCGVNCAVASVKEELTNQNEIWQEVYPHDHLIQLGASAVHVPIGHMLGGADEHAGHGNYVFVVWRHYRGCVQHHGKLLWAMVHVSPTQKR